jgi:voltage-gated potassium channel
MLNRKNRAETDFSSGEAMREFVSFLRHFVYFIHFVRGVLVALLIMVIIGCVLLMETEGFSFGTAVYVTAITALTVGYGDITPKTATGQVVSVAIGFIGVLFNGLIVAIATRALAHAAEDKGKIGSAQPPAGEGGET